MKKLLLLFTISLISFILKAQEATVKIKVLNAGDQKLIIKHPIDGAWFPVAVDEQSLGLDSTVTYKFPVNKTSWLRINGYFFILESGITNILFDYGKKNPLSYTDRNMDGIILFSKRDNQFYQYKARDYYKNDSSAVNLLKRIKENKDAELKAYADLWSAKKISLHFYEEMQNYLNIDAAIMEAAIPMVVLSKTKNLSADLDAMWANAYKKHPLTNLQDTFHPDFYMHADYYVYTYLQYYLNLKKGITLNIKNESDYLKTKYHGFETAFKGKMREYLMVNFLWNEMMQNKFQPVLLELFNDFKKQYPKSNFSTHLESNAKQIEDFNKKKNEDLNQKQKIISDYQKINSFAQLLSQFGDKTVFIDVWATWCGPCKAEFKYSKDLEHFLNAKGIEMLFISTDKDEVDRISNTVTRTASITNSAILQRKSRLPVLMRTAV